MSEKDNIDSNEIMNSPKYELIDQCERYSYFALIIITSLLIFWQILETVHALFDPGVIEGLEKTSHNYISVIFLILISVEIVSMIRVHIEQNTIPPYYPIIIGITSLVRDIIKPALDNNDNSSGLLLKSMAIILLTGALLGMSIVHSINERRNK